MLKPEEWERRLCDANLALSEAAVQTTNNKWCRPFFVTTQRAQRVTRTGRGKQ